ncbi:MAG: DUF3662 domain-containing protein [Acidobacteria bacterium]|nr:DUF3662 domain-containing protein [Acidobacteriota bacterium]
MSVLDKVRRWIDGESAETVLEEAARDAQIKPRSQAEAFIVEIARKVEAVMQREIVPLPQGTTLIPTEYIIFLSEKDDKDWQGAKRRGLEQGLYHILAERAREIAGKQKLKTKSFSIELRVDGTLELGEIVVQHGWDENQSEKTDVFARHKPVLDNGPRQSPPAQGFQVPAAPNFTAGHVPLSSPRPVENSSPETDEMTRVTKRGNTLYNLEIWRNNVRQNTVPIFSHEIVIGRGSKTKPVEIALAGDPEISRRHVVLILDRLGNYSLINEGRNPAILNNTELPLGQRISVKPGDPIVIGSYVVRIQPR